MSETYKKGDTYDESQEGPVVHGVNGTQILPFQADVFGNQTVGFATTAKDAFGRLRVSQPETLFDSKQLHDKLPLFFDDAEVSGSGTSSSYNANQSSTTLNVSDTTAGNRVRQTFMRFNYQPGKSQLIFLTGVLQPDAGGAGITRSFGYYDARDGLFLRDNEGTVEVVRRSYTSGSAVDTAVSQANWNIDPMDGTGPSGHTLDFSKTQILTIDFEWLGVGSVRFGFVVNGVVYSVHQINHANALGLVYMSTPNLPIRYEIANDGNGPAASLDQICSSIMSEGGAKDLGVLRHQSASGLTNLSAGSTYAAQGIRLKSSALDGVVKMIDVSALAATVNDQAYWELVLNPTVAGAFAYADQKDSTVATATGGSANTVTGGTAIQGGYFSTGSPPMVGVDNALRLGASIAGVQDEMVLTIRAITNNIDVETSITWREIS